MSQAYDAKGMMYTGGTDLFTSVCWCVLSVHRTVRPNTLLIGGDEHLCVLSFEITKALSSFCADLTRALSDLVCFESTDEDCASLAPRKKIGQNAARPSDDVDAIRPNRA